MSTSTATINSATTATTAATTTAATATAASATRDPTNISATPSFHNPPAHTLPPWRRWVVQWDISHNAIPLAFFAFTSMWQTAAQHFGMFSVPYIIWYVLYFVSCTILAFCIIVFLTRALLFPAAILSDFNHPRLMNFFFMPVIIGALCILTTPSAWRSLAEFRVGFYILGAYQLGLALFMFGEWLFGAHPTAFIHPLVFMQTIGFFLLSNVGATAHLLDQAWAMFSVGCLLWLLVFITNLQHVALALDKQRERPQPTFFLFIAPPAQAAVAVVVLNAASLAAEGLTPSISSATAESLENATAASNGTAVTAVTDLTSTLLSMQGRSQWPRLAQSFMYVDLFLYLLMFRLFPTFWTSKFSISWWAYIFPLSAAASTTIWRYKSEGGMFWGVLAAILAVIATIAMVVVTSFTLWSLWTRKTPTNPSCLEAYKQHYFRPRNNNGDSAQVSSQPQYADEQV